MHLPASIPLQYHSRMAFVKCFFLLALFLPLYAWLQSGLYHHQNNHVSYGKFTRVLNHQLAVTKITSSLVVDQFVCTFKCIGDENCNSFNLAVHPDSNGLYLCELLPIDKYRATVGELQVNAAFHHYSPWVSRLRSF